MATLETREQVFVRFFLVEISSHLVWAECVGD